jgi:hypothetical protein
LAVNPISKPTISVASPDISDDTMFWALHSTAINPDTQSVAEYEELSKCSDGALWIQANTEEFGRLAEGPARITTCQLPLIQSSLFIPVKCPMDVRQHTCELFVLINLRNHNLDVSDTPSTVTKLIILEAPVQRLLIFQPSKFCSTVLVQLQLAVS